MTTKTHIEKPKLEPFFSNGWKNWNGRDWILVDDWCASIRTENYAIDIYVKAGLVTDGGSVPGFWHFRVNPMGPGLAGFLPHDVGYATHLTIKGEDVRYDYDCMMWELHREESGFGWSKAHAVYRAVRMCGWAPWKNRPQEAIDRANEYVTVISHH